MLQTLLGMVGVDLQAHVGQWRNEAHAFKDRTLQEIKHEVVETGTTVGLAVAGFIFAMLTVVTMLFALFLWIGDQYGPYVALASVGLITAIIAAILFGIASSRGSAQPAPQRAVAAAAKPAPVVPPPAPAAAPAFTASPNASFFEAVAENLSHRAAGPTSDALDSAADIVRRGPKEAVIATLAAAVMVGIFFGRRR